MDSSIVHIQNYYNDNTFNRRVPVTNNDMIDLLKPTLNMHESHYGRTSEIIMH